MVQSGVRLALVVAMVASGTLSACGTVGGLIGRGGSDQVYEITTNRQEYTRGNTGEAAIRNRSDDDVEYNLCQRRLERRVDRSWVTAFEWPTAGSACTTEARTLREGATVNALFEIPTGVPSGTYRVVFLGLRGDDGNTLSADRVATRSFEVR